MEQSKHTLKTYAVSIETRLLEENPNGPLMMREEVEPVVSDLLEALQAIITEATAPRREPLGLYTDVRTKLNQCELLARAAIERATK